MTLIKILVFVIILLGILLALITIKFLSDKKRRDRNSIRKINGLYIYIIFSAVVCLLFILRQYSPKNEIVLTNSQNFSITIDKEIKEASLSIIKKLNNNEHYLDDYKRFYCNIPQSPNWYAPQNISGLAAYLDKIAFETQQPNLEAFLTSRVNLEMAKCLFKSFEINDTKEMHNCLKTRIRQGSIHDLIQSSYSILIRHKETIDLVVQDQTVTPLEHFLENVDSLSVKEDTAIHIEPARVSFSNYFNITVLDKDMIKENKDRLTLANYFLFSSANLVSNIEKIVAEENHLMFTGSLQFDNIGVDGKSKNFNVHRWVRMIDQDRLIYILEIAYSPDTDPTKGIWKSLQASFESFQVLENLADEPNTLLN